MINRQEPIALSCEQLEERQMLSSVDIFAAGVTNEETIQLKIDDTVVRTWTNVGGDAYAGQFVRLTYSSAQDFDSGQIKIEFTNDAINAATGADRNIRIDRIVVDGSTIQTESAGVFSTGTWKAEDGITPGFRQSEFLHGNGYFQYPSGNNGGGAEIQMRVRGSEGTEQFRLLVQGQVVGTFNATTNFQSLSYIHSEAVNANDVQLEFFDSQWIPAQGIDTNLTIDYISIDGQIFQTEASTVYSTGTWTAADGIVPGFGRSDTLHADGYFQFSSSNGNGSEILMRVRGSEGTERFNLLIDGSRVGTYAATSTDSFQTIAYLHDDTVAASQIRVEFINDQWDPVQGIDANLILDFVSIDGRAYQTENPAVLATGVWQDGGVTPGRFETETLNVNGYFQFADVVNTLSFSDSEGDGEWSEVRPLGIIPIHAMVLPDGKVFSFGTDERGMQGGQFVYSLYDPATGIETVLPNTTDTDIFCSNMSIDPATGNVLITGGDRRGEGGPVNQPINDVVVFDYANLTIRDATQGEMEYDRWYGSSVTLPNGEVLTLGGLGGFEDVPEVFNADTGWRTLTGVDIDITYYYPKLWVLSDGSVVTFTYRGDIYKINTEGTGSSEVIGRVNFPHDNTYPGVMYDVDKVAILGTDAKIYTADFSAANPTFTAAAQTLSGRRDGGMSMLPDGRVILTGGSTQFNVLSTAVYATEIWDPSTNEVEQVADVDLGRLYHSTHLLMPDGTIWAGGGGAPGPLTNLNVEFYAPNYLYSPDGTLADRPAITSAPTNVNSNETFQIDVEDSSVINRVTAVRSGALTHAINNDTRFVELNFQIVDGNTIQITALDENSMVPGTWMLFVLDDNGTPSEASMLGVAMVDVVDTPNILPG